MLTQERVRELFTYNETTGYLLRNTKAGNSKVGDKAGSLDIKSGYLKLTVDYKQTANHRVIWLYVYGYLPKYIDHINGNRNDNRLENLREVTVTENNRNKSISKNNKSGYNGISFDTSRNKWIVSIHFKEGLKHLGRFDLLEDAIKVRKEAEIKYGFHENHGRIN